MSDEAIAAAVQQFIKKVSFSTQREIERGIRTAIASGKIRGDEILTAAVTVTNAPAGTAPSEEDEMSLTIANATTGSYAVNSPKSSGPSREECDSQE